MLIEKQDAIEALNILKRRFERADDKSAIAAISIAINEINSLKEDLPKFYLIDCGKEKNERNNKVDSHTCTVAGIERLGGVTHVLV